MLATVYNERFAEHGFNGFNGCFPVCAQLTSKQARPWRKQARRAVTTASIDPETPVPTEKNDKNEALDGLGTRTKLCS
jgi:hypothetical protein